MFGIFQEYQSWVRIMGVPTVGDVNSKVLADGGGLINPRRSVPRAQVRLGGRHHLRRPPFARRPHGADLRPSSSGKPPPAKRLGIQLGVLGLNPVLISLDDYFVDREKTPRDADGTTTTRRSKPPTWSFSTTIWRA